MKIDKINKYFLPAVYLCITLFIKQMIFLFYNSTDSPDFIKYFEYFEFNAGIKENLFSEQGFMYYDIQSFYFHFSNHSLSEENFFIYLSKSIQEVNLILFLIGSIGVYFLLRLYEFGHKESMISLILLSFFPLSLVQIMVFKPETLAFALLPWIILNLEIYIRKNKILNIIFCIPLIASILNLKGSITAMVLFFLVVFYFLPILKNLKTNKKNTFVVAILFAVSFFGIYMENGKQNNKYLFDFFNTTQSSQYSDEIKLIWESDIEKYNNKAPVKIMYSLDLENLIFYPYKNVHNESGLSITFLDTFGDYFDLYWNNDSSEFSKNRSEIIKFIKTENIKSPNIDFEQLKLKVYVQNEFDSYPRKVISLLLSLIFYLTIFFQALKYKKIRKYLFLPLLGYVILITHSVTGIPSNNFDLLSGDTLKPFYYSFFLLISFSFSVVIFVQNYKLKRYILIFFIPLVLISIGFPKDFSLYEANVVNLVNNYSSICEINNFIFDITPTSSCDSTNLSISTYKNYDKFNQLNNINIKFINVAMTLLSILSILLSINTVLRSQKHFVFSRKNIKN